MCHLKQTLLSCCNTKNIFGLKKNQIYKDIPDLTKIDIIFNLSFVLFCAFIQASIILEINLCCLVIFLAFAFLFN